MKISSTVAIARINPNRFVLFNNLAAPLPPGTCPPPSKFQTHFSKRREEAYSHFTDMSFWVIEVPITPHPQRQRRDAHEERRNGGEGDEAALHGGAHLTARLPPPARPRTPGSAPAWRAGRSRRWGRGGATSHFHGTGAEPAIAEATGLR